MSSLKYWLWLSSAKGVGPAAKAAVVKHYGDAEAAFFAPKGEFAGIKGVGEQEAASLELRDLSAADKIEEQCGLQNINAVAFNDSTYPQSLRNIYLPPPVLYVKGRLPDLEQYPAVAVVGTRKASYYGVKMGYEMAWQICCCGGIVISNLSSDIDRQAAVGAIRSGGRCIGVLAQPHEQLRGEIYDEIMYRGSLVSEHPPGTTPYRSFFRDRNRIASGLSLGVVVVEAPEKSGARLFAQEAAEQGKEVFAVPGNANSPVCAGSNALIKEGAKLVTNGWEVMCEFEGLYPEIISPYGGTTPEPMDLNKAHQEKKPEKTKNTKKAKSSDNESSSNNKDLREQLQRLSAEQLEIINAIDKTAVHIDDLIESTGLPATKLITQLTVLEIKGYVKREPGRRFSLNIAKK